MVITYSMTKPIQPHFTLYFAPGLSRFVIQPLSINIPLSYLLTRLYTSPNIKSKPLYSPDVDYSMCTGDDPVTTTEQLTDTT